MVGLVFNEDSPPNLTVTVNTSPNNPDGKTSDRACHIWDAVYASDAYNWNMYNSQSGWARAEPLSYQVAVYSASKLLGLSGARVGWLVTEDPAIAARAREYVELTTAGVSVPAQRIVAKALSDLAQDKGTAWTLRVTRDMMKNCNQFEDHVRPFVLRSCGTENHGVGMFAFFQVKPEHLDKFREALVTAKVTMVTGEACGMTEPGWFRMNLAQDCAYTEAALKQLRSAL
jgi:aspartate/methionine/tyrosine aminotransferase